MTCDSKINLFENIGNPNDIKVLGLHGSQRLLNYLTFQSFYYEHNQLDIYVLFELNYITEMW